MCFSQAGSFSWSAVGLFAAWWVYSKTDNFELASGVFFFFLMEFLQGVQYFFMSDKKDNQDSLSDPNDVWCNDKINQFLTMLGFLHICLQPYFCHVINASLTRSPSYLQQYKVVKRLCLLGGGLLFCRFLLGYFNEDLGYGKWDTMNFQGDHFKSTEWLRGEKLCTYRGKYHLAWSIPMADPSYYVPGAALHCFLMYAPFFALWEKRGMIVQGIFLFATGPMFAAYWTDNRQEQASIWCWASIFQITAMLFLIREGLILNWGKDRSSGADSRSVMGDKDKEKAKATSDVAEPTEKAGRSKSKSSTKESRARSRSRKSN